ncbi:MAG: alanine--tRNA ligase [Chthoniobacterales bacterium]|nr:alanine--tRNA ligase [Chthoniobacterales bacterium]
MTSAEIRQSFLDFFREKHHTIVPSASLLPDSPNLLFTNAGMNQFVPIFLGEKKADVSKWAGAVPGVDTRAADTQKCIRAGGKHNDLEDVGLDTYHHTFFEMLGNWSFGDYFKKEAIDWAWELIVGRWKFPPQRLYATIYHPDKAADDPADRDEEAWNCWAEKFRAVGLDPAVHIVNGNKKDNFWMMGETGPCGPCSELHLDLTPAGDTKGVLVNKGTAECIEIWNLVFIQFNANPDGTFSPLPAKHVDTGMGFERAASIIQGTKGFTDFANAKISNYETDIFHPIFDELEKMSGKKYGSTLPTSGSTGDTEQEKIDVAFRVIADHIRTLSFSIADGIQPGNNDRNYVLRRILRRAVRYGRTLGFKEPFFHKIVGVLVDAMGDVFPEIRAKQAHVEEVLKREEESFNRTLDRGIQIFEGHVAEIPSEDTHTTARDIFKGEIPAWAAFELFDTYGFPLDLTELMARERGLTVDVAGFNELMEKQKARARAAQKKTVIELSEVGTKEATIFLGYDHDHIGADVQEIVEIKGRTAVVVNNSVCYAEMGGQVGDMGEMTAQAGNVWRIANTQRTGNTWLHFLEEDEAPGVGDHVTISIDRSRRAAIQRHHTVTHLLHWALHEVVGHEAVQKGSYVGPDKLTFDFNSAALTAAQLRDIEKLVNERILENARVSWIEVPYTDVKSRKNVMQFFGDKYGETVRVVQIGGSDGALDGYSMELCAGTHARATGEIGLFRIVSEGAVAAGIRRIEAIAGLEALRASEGERETIQSMAEKLHSPVAEMEKKLEAVLVRQKELEKSLKTATQREAAGRAAELLKNAEMLGALSAIVADLGEADGDALQAAADALKSKFEGVIVLGGAAGGAVALVAVVGKNHTAKIAAGKIIQTVAPVVDGKGGGRPDSARGAGKDPSRLADALAAARKLIAGA